MGRHKWLNHVRIKIITKPVSALPGLLTFTLTNTGPLRARLGLCRPSGSVVGIAGTDTIKDVLLRGCEFIESIRICAEIATRSVSEAEQCSLLTLRVTKNSQPLRDQGASGVKFILLWRSNHNGLSPTEMSVTSTLGLLLIAWFCYSTNSVQIFCTFLLTKRRTTKDPMQGSVNDYTSQVYQSASTKTYRSRSVFESRYICSNALAAKQRQNRRCEYGRKP